MNELPHFPSFFPPGCPPDKASDEKRLLFRLCPNSTITESDFVSHYMLNPEKFKDNILAYGLSVFETEDASREALRKSPYLRAKFSYVAIGENNPSRGKTLNTPSKARPRHITWWVYEGVKPHTFFEICGGGNGSNE